MSAEVKSRGLKIAGSGDKSRGRVGGSLKKRRGPQDDPIKRSCDSLIEPLHSAASESRPT